MENLILLASVEDILDSIEMIIGLAGIVIAVFYVGMLIYQKILTHKIEKLNKACGESLNKIVEAQEAYIDELTENVDEMYNEIKPRIENQSDISEEDVDQCIELAQLYLNIPMHKTLEDYAKEDELEKDPTFEAMTKEMIVCSEESRKKALSLIRPIMASGKAGVYRVLGELHVLGVAGDDPIPRDYHEAKVNYERAADLGDDDAMFKLGLMYKEGIACEASSEDAKKWIEKAAEAGNEEAKKWLSVASILG